VEAQVAASGDDRSQVSLLRPAASALAGVLVVACLARFGLTVEALIAAFFAVVLVVLSVIDIERRLLPDRIVLPSALVVLAAQIAVDSGRALECLLAAVGVAAFLLVAGVLSRGGIGMGDVKLGLLLGAGLGKHAVTALLLGSLAGGLVSAVILARGGAKARKRAIPYGPFLALGGIVALLAGAGFSATPF
jgi:leader peptidase (prepilin peptidase) / N-methyltransferase